MGNLNIDSQHSDKGATDATPAPPMAEQRLVLFTLTAFQFVSIADFMIVMPLAPQLRSAFELTAQQFGWVVSIYTLAAGIAGFLAAAVLDRVPRKAAYLALAAGLVLGIACSGLATTYPMLLAARAFAGAFGGVLGGLALAIIADAFPIERHGRATGVLLSSVALASVAGVPLGIVLATREGWGAPFVTLSLLGLPLVGLAAWKLPPLAGHAAGPTVSPLKHLLAILSSPTPRRCLAVTGVLMLSTFCVVPFLGNALVANFGVTEAQLPIVFVVSGLMALVATPLSGRLVDWYGSRTVFFWLVPLSAGMMVMVTHLPVVGLAGASVATGLVMAVNSARMVTVMSLIAGSIDPARRGGYMSVNASVQHVACGLGAMCGGAIVCGDAGEPLQHFGFAGMLAGALMLTTLWLVQRIEPFRDVDHPRG